MDLYTTYLGLPLRNPLVVSAGPLCQDIDNIRRMEDVGAAAVVLNSLFEEQIEVESHDLDYYLDHGAESSAEATRYLPDMTDYNRGPGGYLEHVRRARAAVNIPIIGSLNGSSSGGWLRYARLIEQAGAHALELNIYALPIDPRRTGADVEAMYCNVVREVTAAVRIPVAVKLSPYFSAMANMARRLDEAGADGLVLFNRFYQPDFDLENLEVTPTLTLSTPHELLLRLHWIAVLHGSIRSDLAVTGGVHSGLDVLKCMMAGAQVAMMTSALLKHGIDHVATVCHEVLDWMDRHEYTSIRQMQGSMSRRSAGQPVVFERANYMKVLRNYALQTSQTMEEPTA